MTTLRVIQDYFSRLITAPTGAADGLKEMRRDHPETPELTAIFGETEKLPALERVDIYANMYFFRLLEVLENEYPKVAALVGHAACASERNHDGEAHVHNSLFHNLATDFLIAHPSRNFDIGRIADPMADFLRAHPHPEFPGLHELARLERTRSLVFLAADPPRLLTLPDLQALPPERLGSLPLQLIPAFELLSFTHPVHELWLAVEEGKPADEALAAFAPRPAHLRVWREGFKVYHKEIDDHEAAALDLARAGCSFADICEQLSDRDDPAAAAAQLLATWIRDGLLVKPATAIPLRVI